MPIAENINSVLSYTPSTTDPPLAEGRCSPGMSLEKACQNTDPPPEGRSRTQQLHLAGFRRRRRQLNVNLSRETWPGDPPPRTMAPPPASADPPFVEDRPPGKCMGESFQVPDPPPVEKYHEPGSNFEIFHRRGLDPSMRFNVHPSRETWPGDDPPRAMAPPRAYADPPFVEDRPPGKCMGESFQVLHPPPEDKYHEPGSCFERFHRCGLDLGMRFNGNPSRETFPGDAPPRTMAPPQSYADPPFVRNTPHRLAGVLIQFRSTRSPQGRISKQANFFQSDPK